MFIVYILYSKSLDRYYTGHTANIKNRLLRHNNGRSKATKTGVPWIIVYSEMFNTKSGAYKRELDIKSKKSRAYIETLIAG